jgi:hypothetical protein
MTVFVSQRFISASQKWTPQQFDEAERVMRDEIAALEANLKENRRRLKRARELDAHCRKLATIRRFKSKIDLEMSAIPISGGN